MRSREHGFVFRALLTVAREQPDGYRLLFEYAAREPQFAAFGEGVRRPGEQYVSTPAAGTTDSAYAHFALPMSYPEPDGES